MKKAILMVLALVALPVATQEDYERCPPGHHHGHWIPACPCANPHNWHRDRHGFWRYHGPWCRLHQVGPWDAALPKFPPPPFPKHKPHCDPHLPPPPRPPFSRPPFGARPKVSMDFEFHKQWGGRRPNFERYDEDDDD